MVESLLGIVGYRLNGVGSWTVQTPAPAEFPWRPEWPGRPGRESTFSLWVRDWFTLPG